MGGKKRMDIKDNKIILYANQSDTVLDVIEKDGVCYSKKKYVEKKYEESAQVFTTAYSWFVKEAEKYSKKPEEAEYPYWAFADMYNLDMSGGGNFLKLEVPLDEVVLFDVRDWNRILCMKYVGKNENEENEFKELLKNYGVMETKVMFTTFYPDLKRQIEMSWSNLFRHNDSIKSGNDTTTSGVQAGLWRIKKEWIIK